MLLEPSTLDLEPASERVLKKVGSDTCYRPELRASQIEIVTYLHERQPDLRGARAGPSAS